MARVDGDRAPIRVGCAVEREPVLQDDAEVAVPVGPLGLELEAAFDQFDGVVRLPLLVREDAREVQRVRMIRCNFENRGVDVRRGLPLLGLLQRDANRDRLVERQGAVGARRVTPPSGP
jgi:hypothetical protein